MGGYFQGQIGNILRESVKKLSHVSRLTSPSAMSRRIAFALTLLFPVAQAVAQSSLPTVQPADYGKWESPGPASLSPNGRWLAYGVTRVNEENELRIRPLDRDTAFVVPNGTSATFGADSRWVAYLIGVSPATRERLERERKPIRTALGFRELTAGRTDSVGDIASFRFSADGRFIAMRRYPAEGKRVAELIVQSMATGARMTFGNVGDFAWTDRRPVLALTIETEGGAGNAVQVYDAVSQTIRVLESSPSIYRGLAWRKKSEDLAALRTVAEKGFRDTTHVVLTWTNAATASAPRRVLDPSKAVGIATGLRIADARRPEWTDDGATVFIGLRTREAAADTATRGRSGGPAPKTSDVQVWHSQDVRIMPMQKAQESQDLQRALVAAWHVADNKVVPISREQQETTRILAGGKHAIEYDRSSYEFGTMFGRPYQDIWLVDVRSGQRTKTLEKVRYFHGPSPSGRKLAWYDGTNYWSYDIATGTRTNLSAAAKTSFADVDWDFPGDMTPPEGNAGWTKDEKGFLAYDTHDIWLLAADGKTATKLTSGSADGTVHRIVRLGPTDEGVDLLAPVYLSLTGKLSKKSGYGRLTSGKSVERLVYDSARVIRLMKADSADVLAFTRERFNDAPDWYVSGALLRDPQQVTNFNAFQAGFAWGKSELVNFTSAAERPLQAALYYPANYDPSKKYPMIVYTYELLSQNVHQYPVPSERSYYNTAVWTANGYFVLQPDIVFRGRDPGISVLEAVVPAVKAIIARGLVDSARVGHVGHSWGGYEATFLPTRTHIFAATVAGAPITNFLSFAGAIHWTPGIAEFDHWETGQARMDVPFWEDMDAYLRNSPAAKVHELRTPILMEVGDADGTVDWHQGIEFYNFARRAGRKDFILLVYPGEDHGLRKKENQIDYHRRINEWFGHYLKGELAPKWMKDGVTWLERKAVLDGNK
jgi:dipeptidyl aminopeptidase/acylaminoacyl peptidase